MNRKLNALALAALAGLASQASAAFIEVTGDIATDTRWTRDNVYILREVTHVLPPAKLIIEPGTIIRGVKDGSGFDTAAPQEPGSLFICRGAKLVANGTPDDPIIFTSIDDPYVIGGTSTIPPTVNGNPVIPKDYSPTGATNSNGFAYDKEWGGLVILGEGPLGYDGDGDGNILTYNVGNNTFTGDTITYPNGTSPLASAPFNFDVKDGNGVGICLIEGSQLVTITNVTYTEPFPGATNAPASGEIFGGVYGGLNRADNNGIISFVSSRYGGFNLGADNELNGISFGGTGSAFVGEWLESWNNGDDGFEFFGGYTHFRNLFSLFHGDDGFDGDNGFSGTIQFAFGICDNSTVARSGWGSNNTSTGRPSANNGEHVAEWDGSVNTTESGNQTFPNTVPVVYNLTAIPGLASGRDALRNRRGTGGEWFNGLVQNSLDDAWQPGSPAANPSLTQNFFVYSNVADNATQLGATIYSDDAGTALATELANVSRMSPGGIDPRLRLGAASANVTKFNTPANRTDSFPYSGWAKAPIGAAMRDNNKLKGWSILDYLQMLPASNIARPSVTLGVSGSNPTVSWNSAPGVDGRTALYIVERSTDQKNWEAAATISDNNGAGTTDFSGTTFAVLDTDGLAGKIAFTDSVALPAGGVVYYRVTPL